jgi:hypothetical protein
LSHCRFAIGFVRHPKVSRLSDAAFRLWVSAMHHAREVGTNGRLDEADLDMVPRCPPRGPKRKALVQELVTARLWDSVDGAWQIHDYTHWQDSAERVKRKRDAACDRARAYREREALRKANVMRDEMSDARGDHHTSISSGSDSGEGSPEGNQVHDDERSTICPLDLEQKAEKLGVIAELCDQLKVDYLSVQHGIREFVSYWTIGAGAGKKRSNWMLKLREHIRRSALDGKLKAPGAIEHDSRNGRGATGHVAPSKYAAEALQVLREQRRE